ncbi:hypothetical protein I7I51_05629 [Histoplasma capsulatum]|uniref:Uncharacterized protein n=1 Tax=Ajellomyces capsulatus TaxID=5037 RepID=A0A8A1M5B4_AJECA|nr:hypothetical protein I7I51_05629 [Histoplasma capsulatum]
MWLSGPCIASIRGSDGISHDSQVAVTIVACFAISLLLPVIHAIISRFRGNTEIFTRLVQDRILEADRMQTMRTLTGHIAEEHSFESAMVPVIVSEDNIEDIRKR